jgi:hypothetical protein
MDAAVYAAQQSVRCGRDGAYGSRRSRSTRRPVGAGRPVGSYRPILHVQQSNKGVWGVSRALRATCRAVVAVSGGIGRLGGHRHTGRWAGLREVQSRPGLGHRTNRSCRFCHPGRVARPFHFCLRARTRRTEVAFTTQPTLAGVNSACTMKAEVQERRRLVVRHASPVRQVSAER